MIVLILFAAYAVFVVVVAIVGSGHGSGFWASLGLIVVLAAAALWLARRIYRRNTRPSQ
jgi:membrane protein implicated in regulation of membrane protease activity